MRHTVKNFDHLIGEVKGISEKQFRAHFKLYEGYVKKINEIEEKLNQADPSTANYSYGEFSELMRRRPVAYNGAYLHQLFFENLTGKSTQPGSDFKMALEQSFGSLDQWSKSARAVIQSGHGWVLLCRSRFDNGLRNILIEEHHRGLLPEQDILLALDGWEHAYMIDYGVDKPAYIDSIMTAINWNVITQRYEGAQVRSSLAA